jgi:hypothetical protein
LAVVVGARDGDFTVFVSELGGECTVVIETVSGVGAYSGVLAGCRGARAGDLAVVTGEAVYAVAGIRKCVHTIITGTSILARVQTARHSTLARGSSEITSAQARKVQEISTVLASARVLTGAHRARHRRVTVFTSEFGGAVLAFVVIITETGAGGSVQTRTDFTRVGGLISVDTGASVNSPRPVAAKDYRVPVEEETASGVLGSVSFQTAALAPATFGVLGAVVTGGQELGVDGTAG